MVRFTAPQAPNCSPNAGRSAVVGREKLKSRADIVCQLDSSFTQLGLSGVVENTASLRHWQIATVIHCRLRSRTESKRSRFLRSVVALTVIQLRKPPALRSKRRAIFSPPAMRPGK